MKSQIEQKDLELTEKLLDKTEEILKSKEIMRPIDIVAELLKIVEDEYDI